MADQRTLIADFVNRRLSAMIGASKDQSKFGYRVFRTLRAAGYVVYPINPKGGELEGARIYPSLADLPQLPEVVNLVVPPAASEAVVREAHKLGITRIWMQPGAESEAAIVYCRDHGMKVVYDACAMVHCRWWD